MRVLGTILATVLFAACGGDDGSSPGAEPVCTDVDTLTGPREICADEYGSYPEAPAGCFRFTVDPAVSEDTAIFCPPADWQGDWFSWRTETPCNRDGRQGYNMAIRATESGARPGEVVAACKIAADCMRDAVLGNAACCAETRPTAAPVYWNCDGSPI